MMPVFQIKIKLNTAGRTMLTIIPVFQLEGRNLLHVDNSITHSDHYVLVPGFRDGMTSVKMETFPFVQIYKKIERWNNQLYSFILTYSNLQYKTQKGWPVPSNLHQGLYKDGVKIFFDYRFGIQSMVKFLMSVIHGIFLPSFKY